MEVVLYLRKGCCNQVHEFQTADSTLLKTRYAGAKAVLLERPRPPGVKRDKAAIKQYRAALITRKSYASPLLVEYYCMRSASTDIIPNNLKRATPVPNSQENSRLFFRVYAAPFWKLPTLYFSYNGHRILFILIKGFLSATIFEARLLFPNYPIGTKNVTPVAGTHYTLLLRYNATSSCCRCCRSTEAARVTYYADMVRSLPQHTVPAPLTVQVSTNQSKVPWQSSSLEFAVSGLQADELSELVLGLSQLMANLVAERLSILITTLCSLIAFAGYLAKIGTPVRETD